MPAFCRCVKWPSKANMPATFARQPWRCSQACHELLGLSGLSSSSARSIRASISFLPGQSKSQTSQESSRPALSEGTTDHSYMSTITKIQAESKPALGPAMSARIPRAHTSCRPALGSKIGGVSLRNHLSVSNREELVELILRKPSAAPSRRRKGARSVTLSASLDPYETLGVSRKATDKEIKQAYRKLALKLHPDVNKAPDAQQQFLRVKNAYQTLSDEKSRAKYDGSKRGSPSWDPYSWEAERKSAQKSQEEEEEFYGFEDFFRDLQADSRRQATKPKSLWEELADIGEEFVEFLEKELNISDAVEKEEKASGYDSRNDKNRSDGRDAKKKSEGSTQSARQDQEAQRAQVETEIAEIEDMLAQLKKELGI